ncbi:hypothetical protein NSA31_21920 [Bacillus subtilis]|uniref:hypothetical protein n=1 Tax=Bacillus subtilis group TaxID=653685 RepID=UPI002149BB24|nr:hypothetical protein [Bacillus subtilis]MCR1994398.1 hypothetical protein [Bacillus subtilis]
MKEYLILTTRYKDLHFGGSVHLFWGINSSGYTAILQRAGLYTKEEAFKIGKHSEGQDIPVHFSKFGFDRAFFETKERFVQMPVLYSISEESKKIIADWQKDGAAE